LDFSGRRAKWIFIVNIIPNEVFAVLVPVPITVPVPVPIPVPVPVPIPIPVPFHPPYRYTYSYFTIFFVPLRQCLEERTSYTP